MRKQAAPHQSRDLTEGHVAKTLLAFALPALMVNVLQSINGTIGAIYVGKMLGEEALAATANANMVMFAIFATVFGFSMAATILVGQAAGRKDMDEIRRTTGASVGLFALTGFVVAAGGWAITPTALRWLATPDSVYPLAVDYLRLVMLGIPISMVNMLVPSLLRGVGDAVSPLRNTVLNVALCVILNPLLIPVFGIKGAAFSMIAANIVSGAALIATIYRKRMPLALYGADLHYLRPDWGDARPVVTLGFPLGVSMIIMSASQLVIIGLINREGMETVAAYGAVNQLWGFLQMPAIAVGSAASAMAAQNIGANRWDRIDRITWAGIGINIAMTAILVSIMTLFQAPLLGLFLPVGSPAIAIGVHINLMVGWTFVLMGVSMVVTSVVRANGAVMVPLWILIATAVVLRFAIAFPGYPAWGANAIWASFAANAVGGTLLSIVYYRWGKWRQKHVKASIPAEAAFPEYPPSH